MNIDFNAWYALESAMQDEQSRRVSRATLKRVARFAHPQRRAVYALLATSAVAAVLAVASPVLAGRVVDTIIGGRDFGLVVWLALAIAGVAVLEAGFSLAERWQSSRVGEDLILRLRQAVFDHVQRMPIAFFTRTRTGALVSRLNNDVIAAQRAFSETISGVVTNVIALVLTLVVMLTLSWQVTLLAMVLLPIFLIPARRMGKRLASMHREAANLDSAMTTQMTERFSAPGATLIKLFGRPSLESAEFGDRKSVV